MFAQVFFIGLYLFAKFDLGLHLLGALVVTVVALIILVVTFVARLDTQSKRYAAVLFVLTIVQGALPGMKESAGVIAALHPVNALVLFWLGVIILRDAQAYVRADETVSAETATAEAPAPAR
jgi:heme A synthase